MQSKARLFIIFSVRKTIVRCLSLGEKMYLPGFENFSLPSDNASAPDLANFTEQKKRPPFQTATFGSCHFGLSSCESLFALAENISILFFDDDIRAHYPHADPPSFAYLPGLVWIVSQGILPPEFFGNARERRFQVPGRVRLELSSAAILRERFKITQTGVVVFRTCTCGPTPSALLLPPIRAKYQTDPIIVFVVITISAATAAATATASVGSFGTIANRIEQRVNLFNVCDRALVVRASRGRVDSICKEYYRFSAGNIYEFAINHVIHRF